MKAKEDNASAAGCAGQLLTKAEVASLLRIKPRTVLTWCGLGLPYIKLGLRVRRFRKSDIEQWLESKCTIITNEPKP